MSFQSELTEYRVLYHNGSLWRSSFYLNDKLEGERKVWHENGHFCIKEFYQAGLLEGTRKTYYPCGRPMDLAYYTNDKVEGVCKFWRPDGRLIVFYWINNVMMPAGRYCLLFKFKGYLSRRVHNKILDAFLVPDLIKFGVEK